MLLRTTVHLSHFYAFRSHLNLLYTEWKEVFKANLDLRKILVQTKPKID